MTDNELIRGTLEDRGIEATSTPGSHLISAGRIAMATPQKSQAMPTEHSSLPHWLTGLEKQVNESAMGVRAPCDMRILGVIEKYPNVLHRSNVTNPLYIIIYSNLKTGEVDALDIESFQNQLMRHHGTFTYRFRPTDKLKEIINNPKGIINEGEWLTRSPSQHEGRYSVSVNLNICYLSTYPTIEDGFALSVSAAQKISPTAYGEADITWGADEYPLHTYGEQIAPGIDDEIRPDGLLFAKRKKDPMLDGILRSRKHLSKIDTVADNCHFAKAGAVVADVTAYANNNLKNSDLPPASLSYLEDYAESNQAYLKEIEAKYKAITYGAGNPNAKIGPTLSGYLVKNMALQHYYYPGGRGGRITISSRQDVIKQARINIKYLYKFKSDLAAKLSNFASGKGVTVSIFPDNKMPIDDYGVRSDIVASGKGTVARLIGEPLYTQFVNATMRDVRGDMLEMVEKGDKKGAWDHLEKLINCISALDSNSAKQLTFDDKMGIVDEAIKYGIYIHTPTTDAKWEESIYHNIMAFRPPNKSPVTYYPTDDVKVRTKMPVLIGEMPFLPLDKLDHKPYGGSSPLRQHHGLPAIVNRESKHRTPVKEQLPSVFGNAEMRSGVSVMGGLMVQELFDRTTNPQASRHACKVILEADDVNNIPNLVDRNVVPYAGRGILFVQHKMACRGLIIELVKKENT